MNPILVICAPLPKAPVLVRPVKVAGLTEWNRRVQKFWRA